MAAAWILPVLLLLSACGRFFPTTLEPAARQAGGMTVNDDGSVTYDLGRLAITLKPMTDAELNRQFPAASQAEAASVNPYTFGNWTPPGQDWTPPRFTVFRLEVANYQFPKVKLDPLKAHIATANNRSYPSLSFGQLYDYYRAYWQGRTGQGRVEFRSRTDILKQTMYSDATVFSGTEAQGYLVFPLLDDDVEAIQVHLDDIALRFDYADLPVETADLSFSFLREVLQGYTPADATRRR